MGFFTSFLDLLFPPKCVFCLKLLRGADYWCHKCEHELLLTVDGGRQEGEFYDFCVSPLYYSGDVRKSIHRFKFRGSVAYAEAYAKILASCIKDHVDVKYDIISWVPLSGKRKRLRGYDQAMLLALATALELDDVAAETLVKPRDVQAQSELRGKEERSANIEGAYEVTDRELVEGKCLLLVDDIITTGSTLDECAKVLLSAGASKVICAALAKGTQS